MSKKKISLIFISGLFVGVFLVNPVLRLLGVPSFDNVLTFLFG